jgi:hypothetical protein
VFLAILSALTIQCVTRGVSHCGIAIDIKKYLNVLKDYENSNMQKYNFQKILKKKPKSFKTLQLYNSSQVSTQAKISSFKNPHIKLELLLLPRGQNPLSYYTL